jgi:hypothetical protein
MHITLLMQTRPSAPAGVNGSLWTPARRSCMPSAVTACSTVDFSSHVPLTRRENIPSAEMGQERFRAMMEIRFWLVDQMTSPRCESEWAGAGSRQWLTTCQPLRANTDHSGQ